MPATELEQIFLECARMASGAGVGALASVVRRRGSLPMSATARMLVGVTGTRLGTVGGGCLEAEIIERAMDVAERRQPALSEHTLSAELAGDYGLTCGGTVVMSIEPVFADDRLRAVYDATVQALANDEPAVLASEIDWTAGVRKALIAGHRVIGSVSDATLSRVRRRPAGTELPELSDDAVLEPVTAPPRLVVYGAGHVGARVAEAAQFAGWRVTVVDDRAEYADASRLPFVERAVTADVHDAARAVPLDARTYAVICTRGHQHDAIIAAQLAPLGLRYLGMLGSRRKVALTWQLLEKWGVARAALERIHAPVGLSIGADSPAEIAISVVAEMIAARRAGSRRRGGVDAQSRSSRRMRAPR